MGIQVCWVLIGTWSRWRASRVREQLKVDCIRYGLKASVVGVKMIAAVVYRKILSRVSRVMCGRILIDHPVTAA
jgi:hypothetical protein